jgi:predicted Zn finger-like uncharacterized protein
MRLTCPNCKAQYEVADSAIPARGRDVQCSSCGRAWFERPAPDAVAARAKADPAAPRQTEVPAAQHGGAGPAASSDAIVQTEPGAASPGLKKRALDPAVAEILRAEASREARERRQEAVTGLQSQEEFALDVDPAQHDTALAEELAPAPRPAPTTTRRSEVPRRDLLPDIEEINSSLRAKSVLRSGAAAALTEEEREERARRGRGFRIGFSSILIVALFALLLYSYADSIVQSAPGLTGPIEAYVNQINALRLWLDGQMATGANVISGVLQGATP